jgi:hypothetical protein
MIWREKRAILIVLGVLLLANTVFFFTYRVQYQRRLQSLEDRRSTSDQQLRAARNARVAAEHKLAVLHQVQRDVTDVYGKEWATEHERLVPFIAEINRLAVASELIPKSIAYGRIEKEKKSGTNTETVTINFGVQGNYQQVRRLINLLELSRQFVIIDSIALASSENDTLSLNLQLKTLFREPSISTGRES